MIQVKVCGIRRWQDALAVQDTGAHAVGFVFYPKSPRYVPPERALSISRMLSPFIAKVGVFVDSPLEEVLNTLKECRLTVAQLHGKESPRFCESILERGFGVVKAVHVEGGEKATNHAKNIEELKRFCKRYLNSVSAFLVDTKHPTLKGGTGTVCDWTAVAAIAREYPVILAGGLNSANVEEAVKRVKPLGVDVSSGVEIEPGIKDHMEIRRFVAEVWRRSNEL